MTARRQISKWTYARNGQYFEHAHYSLVLFSNIYI